MWRGKLIFFLGFLGAVLLLLWATDTPSIQRSGPMDSQEMPSSVTGQMFKLVMIDFDGTITTEDTCSLMYQATERYQKSDDSIKTQLDTQWNSLAVHYLKNHYETLHRELSLLPPPGTRGLDFNALEAFLNTMETSDHRSTINVRESGILDGVTNNGLMAASRQVVVQDGCQNVLRKMSSLLQIVSVSWSGELISHALDGVLRCRDCIHANWLLANNNISDGSIDSMRRLTTAKDKKETAMRLIKARDMPGKSVFIGDSMTDLLAMLTADIGILVGSSSATLKVINQFGITLEPLSSLLGLSWNDLQRKLDHVQHVVYKAESWWQIDNLLSS